MWEMMSQKFHFCGQLDKSEKNGQQSSRRRPALIASGLLIVVSVLWIFLRGHRPYLSSSSDGSVRFLEVQYYRGTNFSFAFGGRFEARVRDALFAAGIRRIQRTSFKMTSPPDSHVFVLEYSANLGQLKPNVIKAELVADTGRTYDLVTIGGGEYGISKRQFAYWVLNGVTNINLEECRLKVFLPPDIPSLLPTPIPK
jgi:hypothetical protein